MADGYFPESIAEAVKIGGCAIAALIIFKKFLPGPAYSAGAADLPKGVKVVVDANGVNPTLTVAK